MIKGKYLIIGHMWWCSLVVGMGIRKVEVVGSNPGNSEKNRTRAYSRKKSCDLRHERGGKKNFFIFVHIENIYLNTQKNDAPHLCVDIDDGLRLS